MKLRIFLIIFCVVVAAGVIGSNVAESADIGTTVKEQQQKLTEKAGAVTGDGFEAKIKEQQALIDKAAASKTLSKEEANTVQENLKRIKEKKAAVSKDGKMSELEKGNVQNMLDRNNKMITDKKNNPVKPFTRPEITHRFENQQKRIDQGVKSGALSKQEAAKLQDNLAKAKTKHTELSKDGKFTQAEEEKMHDLLDKDSKAIEGKKQK
jgi:polyhydroxyalkanoate synthesis regulator phasin